MVVASHQAPNNQVVTNQYMVTHKHLAQVIDIQWAQDKAVIAVIIEAESIIAMKAAIVNVIKLVIQMAR